MTPSSRICLSSSGKEGFLRRVSFFLEKKGYSEINQVYISGFLIFILFKKQ
jgi:hypothetical protein